MTIEEYLVDNPKKHIIFDLDETLATLHVDWGRCRDKLFAIVEEFDDNLPKQIEKTSGSANKLRNLLVANHDKDKVIKFDTYWTQWEIDNYITLY